MSWHEEYERKLVSMEAVAKQVKSGDVVGTGLGIGACSPEFYDALFDQYEELSGVRIVDSLQLRLSKLYDPVFMAGMDGHINYCPGFGVVTVRQMHAERLADFAVCTSSDSGDKMANIGDVFIEMVTPPNKQGYVNLGLTNFYSLQAMRQGKASGKQRVTIAEINDQMPVIYGDNWMHVSEFDYFVENSTPIPCFGRGEPGEIEKKIAGYVLELINDGDTFQMGIGGITEAVAKGLEGKRDLGVLTEMFPTGLQGLVEKGIVNNKLKPYHKGVTIASFCIGDQAMYDYVEENPECEFYPASYTNDPSFIAQHPNMVAMNMALLIDLTGQICSEGLGHRMISGSGGQLDFMIGSYYSKGGKGITLLTSARELADGTLVSSIVPDLPSGTPITVPRTFADYVITEYGIAHLKYKTRRERAEALINIAHPDLRGELRDSMKSHFYPTVQKKAAVNF